jgi:Flp pilus assembly protein TadG
MKRSFRRKQAGATIIEFTLSLMFLMPLLLGTLVFGFRLVTSQQINQITRDLAHMYSRGIAFNTTAGTTESASLADQFGLTTNGNSVVIFSTITLMTAAGCNTGTGLNTNTCNNLNKAVFTSQVAIGNAGANGSYFGTPTASGSLTATPSVSNNYSTTVSAANQATASWAVANNFLNIITLTAGQPVYMVEMYNHTPSLSISGITGLPQVYSRAIF